MSKKISFVGRVKFDIHIDYPINYDFIKGEVSYEALQDIKSKGRLIKKDIGGSVHNTCLNLSYLDTQDNKDSDKINLQIEFYGILGQGEAVEWLSLASRPNILLMINRTDVPTAEVVFVHLPDSKLKVVYSYGNSGKFEKVLPENHQCDLFYTSLFELSKDSENFLVEYINNLKNNTNPNIWLNLGGISLERDEENLTEILAMSDVIIGNKKESLILMSKGVNLERLVETKNAVFVTNGRDGTTLVTPRAKEIYRAKFEGGQFFIGAGDAFAASVIHSYLKNGTFENILESACEFARQKTFINSPYMI